jgi:alcohol dehydrogenase class IV
VRRFTFHRLEEVVYATPAAEAVPALLARRSARRPLVLAANSLLAMGAIDDLVAAIPGATVTPAPSAHAPRHEILAAAWVGRNAHPDAIVAVGGGSAIDGAKAVALALSAQLKDDDDFDPYLFGFDDGVRVVPALPPPQQVIVAVPTTLSGAEINGGFGMIDVRTGVKRGCASPAYGARAIVYDPDLAAHTPTELWNSSAARLVDHAVEGMISRWSSPMNAALGAEALSLARDALGGHSRQDRDLCQRAAWLAMYPLESAGLGLSHAIGHVIGPRFGISHGATSALMLPAVMAFVADVSAGPLARVATALAPDEPPSPETATRAVRELMDRLGLPARLRDVAVPREALAETAAEVMGDFGIAACPRPVTVADVRAVLEAAW